MCELFGKTRQAWYKTIRVQEVREMREAVILSGVKDIRKKLPRCGLRKLHFKLQNFMKMHAIYMGRDKLEDLLRAHNLLIKKKKRGHVTTDSNHRFRRYANRAADLEVTRVNQLWVCDITYIPVGRKFMYLSLITDVFSRKKQTKEAVARAIHLYNRFRPHLSLEYLTPDQMYYDTESQRKAIPQQLELFTSPEAGL